MPAFFDTGVSALNFENKYFLSIQYGAFDPIFGLHLQGHLVSMN
jgi:hypothetical protein